MGDVILEPEDYILGEVSLSSQVKDSSMTYTIAEVMPQFPGGDKALIAYLTKNIEYPIWEADQAIEGILYVSFIVEKDGTLSHIKILRSVKGSKNMDKAAIDLISNMPKWRPGTQRGETVRVRYNMPIRFTLSKN